MSDDRCRCDDIRYYEKELKKMERIYTSMNSNFINLSVMSNHAKMMEGNELNMYEACNKVEVSSKIGKITYSMEERLREAINVINKEKGRISHKISSLSAEDRRHHEAEKRRKAKG